MWRYEARHGGRGEARRSGKGRCGGVAGMARVAGRISEAGLRGGVGENFWAACDESSRSTVMGNNLPRQYNIGRQSEMKPVIAAEISRQRENGDVMHLRFGNFNGARTFVSPRAAF